MPSALTRARLVSDKPFDLDKHRGSSVESRHLFYVGLTRARDAVHMLYSGWVPGRYGLARRAADAGQTFEKGPQLAGISYRCSSRPRSLRADSGDFGAQSPVQKFPFLGDLLRAGIRLRPLSAGTKYNADSGLLQLRLERTFGFEPDLFLPMYRLAASVRASPCV
jgi:hypothetical protein